MKIFCDLDGTLIDVSNRHYLVYSEMIHEFGGSPLSKDEYWQLKRQKIKWNKLLPMSGLKDGVEPAFLEGFIKKIEDPKYLELDTLFPESLNALNTFLRIGQCYLVSLRRNRVNLLQEIERLDLSGHFTDVLTGHSENDGYDVKIALIKDRVQNDEALIVGDTEADIITGKELGFKTFAVTSGIRDKQFLADLKPDHLVKGIEEVAEILARG